MKNCLLFLFLLVAGFRAPAQQIDHKFKGDWVKPRVKTATGRPVVAWQKPQGPQLTVDAPTVTVTVCVQSADPLTDYRFVHNGTPLGSMARGFKRTACGQEIAEELHLVPGTNEVHFVATNKVGMVTTESHYITYTPHQMVLAKSGAVAGPARLALVVANGSYPKYPLRNPVNDGQAIRERLEKLGFTVMLRENQSRKELRKSIDAFTASLTDKSVSLFFYAGHGLMVNGTNYVQPVDADPTVEADVEFDCFPLRQLIARMEETNPNGSNLVFWDACRNNPYRSWNRGTGGPVYAATNPPVGTMIVYATEPGKAAQDGDDLNGLFTSELVKHIAEPDQDIFELVDKIDRGLEQRGFKQSPYIEGRLRGKFIFNATPK